MTRASNWIVQNDLGPVGHYITERLTALSRHDSARVLVAAHQGNVSPNQWLDSARPTALILGGSLSSVTEPEPWMAWEYELIQEAIRRRVPTLGLCFGHQAMAVAAGGAVERREMRRGPNRIVPEGDSPLLRGVTDWSFVGTHEDHVTRIPPGFDRIATSEYCAIQGMQHRSSPAFGFQFHPCYDATAIDVKQLGLSRSEAYANADGARLIYNFLLLARRHISGTAA